MAAVGVGVKDEAQQPLLAGGAADAVGDVQEGGGQDVAAAGDDADLADEFGDEEAFVAVVGDGADDVEVGGVGDEGEDVEGVPGRGGVSRPGEGWGE